MAKKNEKKKLILIGVGAFIAGGILGDKLDIIQKLKGMFNRGQN